MHMFCRALKGRRGAQTWDAHERICSSCSGRLRPECKISQSGLAEACWSFCIILLLATYTPSFSGFPSRPRRASPSPSCSAPTMTSKTHPRSPSPPPNAEQPALLKRLKSSHISEDPASTAPDPTPHFAPNLFVPSNIHRLHTEYENSGPFKHAVVEKLFQDDLLKNVKDEALAELSFSEKETDIYKVRSRAILRSPRGYHASRLPSRGL